MRYGGPKFGLACLGHQDMVVLREGTIERKLLRPVSAAESGYKYFL